MTSPIQHPWVDSIGRLSFPSLSRWVGSNLRLAAVVSEAIQHLDSAMLVPGKGKLLLKIIKMMQVTANHHVLYRNNHL